MLMLITVATKTEYGPPNFNTSHVNVNHLLPAVEQGQTLFQYISC